MNLFSRAHNLLHKKPQVIVIVGPTASGKSDYAIKLAQKLDGELVSCDSRQIYKEIEIFSGAAQDKTDVSYHLQSYVDLSTIYSVQDYVDDALPMINKIINRGKTPIVVGGTGYWAQALLYNIDFPNVPTNSVYRETLHGETTDGLYARLNALDPERASSMDPHNRKRLVRSLEIVKALGHVPRLEKEIRRQYNFELVYLTSDNESMKKRISKNINSRIKQGMIAEARSVAAQYSSEQIKEVGLGYKYIEAFLSGEITEDEFKVHVLREEYRYAKRQKTFLNKLFKEFPGKKRMSVVR